MPRSFSFSSAALSPVPFHEHPLAMAMNPPMGDPTRAGTRRTVPPARRPHIVVAFPVVIAADPRIPAVWRWRTPLDNRGRRCDHNSHLRKRRSRKQGKSKQYCQSRLFHHQSNPPLVFKPCRNVRSGVSDLLERLAGRIVARPVWIQMRAGLKTADKFGCPISPGAFFAPGDVGCVLQSREPETTTGA